MESIMESTQLTENAANTVVLSLSGGLDSTMLMMYWLSKGKKVITYSFDYGQTHKVELKKVKKNIAYLQKKGLDVTHSIIDLKSVFNESASSLRGNGSVPHGHYAEESMKSTVVENRNIIFSSIIYGKALAYATRNNENVIISLGLHSGDHYIYPDCRPQSQEMAAELFKISNIGSEKVEYITPFNDTDKAGVLQRGIDAMKELGFTTPQMKVVLKNSHTCYDPNSEGNSCGECGSCTERLEAFAKVGLFMDPAQYSNPEAAEAKYNEFYARFHTKVA